VDRNLRLQQGADPVGRADPGTGEDPTPSPGRGERMLSEQEATKITQVAAIVGLAVGLLAVAV
jgi:hypothetical protein